LFISNIISVKFEPNTFKTYTAEKRKEKKKIINSKNAIQLEFFSFFLSLSINFNIGEVNSLLNKTITLLLLFNKFSISQSVDAINELILKQHFSPRSDASTDCNSSWSSEKSYNIYHTLKKWKYDLAPLYRPKKESVEMILEALRKV
jgi:hypothetical protein